MVEALQSTAAGCFTGLLDLRYNELGGAIKASSSRRFHSSLRERDEAEAGAEAEYDGN
jgi:hypothetical protein